MSSKNTSTNTQSVYLKRIKKKKRVKQKYRQRAVAITLRTAPNNQKNCSQKNHTI